MALQALPQLVSLTDLNAGYTNIAVRGLHALGALAKLKVLNLDSCNQVTDQGATSLRLLTSLQRCGYHCTQTPLPESRDTPCHAMS